MTESTPQLGHSAVWSVSIHALIVEVGNLRKQKKHAQLWLLSTSTRCRVECLCAATSRAVSAALSAVSAALSAALSAVSAALAVAGIMDLAGYHPGSSRT